MYCPEIKEFSFQQFQLAKQSSFIYSWTLMHGELNMYKNSFVVYEILSQAGLHKKIIIINTVQVNKG